MKIGNNSSAPLPGREGSGVGTSPQTPTPAATRPTPNPSLPGRGATSASTTPDTSRLRSKDNLDKAGTQFETVFTRMMLKAMRAPKLAETMFESKALDTFRDMADGQVAETMATHAPMGIGKAVTAFLAKSQADLNESSATPDVP